MIFSSLKFSHFLLACTSELCSGFAQMLLFRFYNLYQYNQPLLHHVLYIVLILYEYIAIAYLINSSC